LQKIIIGEKAFPANGVQSDAEIRQLLTQASNTIYHASYTNAMGRSNDTQAVVDSEARAIGVQTLRVVDASFFPFLPAGHPQNVSCKFSADRTDY
jgi:choline dehydrogenase